MDERETLLWFLTACNITYNSTHHVINNINNLLTNFLSWKCLSLWIERVSKIKKKQSLMFRLTWNERYIAMKQLEVENQLYDAGLYWFLSMTTCSRFVILFQWKINLYYIGIYNNKLMTFLLCYQLFFTDVMVHILPCCYFALRKSFLVYIVFFSSIWNI